jgi:DNA-binding XRE family transcriptional regulator
MNRVKVSKRLIELRGDKSRKEVALDLGISTSSLIKYEIGERMPRDSVKIKIAKYYNKSVQDIFFNK